jgi:hypothetical protein
MGRVIDPDLHRTHLLNDDLRLKRSLDFSTEGSQH